MQGDDSEGGWRGRGGHHSVPTRMPVLKEAKDTQGINSGGSPNDSIASDCSTPQFHAINYVSLYSLVCEYNCSLRCSSLVKKKIARMIYICTIQLFCDLHLNNHIFMNV